VSPVSGAARAEWSRRLARALVAGGFIAESDLATHLVQATENNVPLSVILIQREPELRDVVLNTLGQLARMRVVERVQLGLKGGREMRLLLIRDSCKVVQRAVLQSPLLSDQEVESFAGMASMTDETLRLIAGNRKYRKNYTITKALVFNPKSPLDITLHLLPLLKPLDVKFLTTNKNVPETLRTAAARLVRQRSTERSS